MPKVRGGAQKWMQRAQAATQDYRQGVQQPRVNWDVATIAAADTYAAGIQQAINDGRFAKGVQAAGQAYWQQRAATIGASRYAEGVRSGIKNYEEGFAPYRQVIESTQLPPRGPRGAVQNYQRTVEMGQALHNARMQIKRS